MPTLPRPRNTCCHCIGPLPSSLPLLLPGADGSATPRFAAYGATKRGLSQLGRSLEAELKLLGVKNVGIHNLSPGMVTTELLMTGADTPTAKFFINCLAEEPQEVGFSLASHDWGRRGLGAVHACRRHLCQLPGAVAPGGQARASQPTAPSPHPFPPGTCRSRSTSSRGCARYRRTAPRSRAASAAPTSSTLLSQRRTARSSSAWCWGSARTGGCPRVRASDVGGAEAAQYKSPAK